MKQKVNDTVRHNAGDNADEDDDMKKNPIYYRIILYLNERNEATLPAAAAVTSNKTKLKRGREWGKTGRSGERE